MRVDWLVMGLVVAVQVADAAPRNIEPAPDAEILEFLGTWATDDGKWMDPMQLEDIPLPETGEQGEKTDESRIRQNERKSGAPSEHSSSPGMGTERQQRGQSGGQVHE